MDPPNATAGMNSSEKCVIYVLALERGKYYVGKTTDVDAISSDNAWIATYKPVSILHTYDCVSDLDEDYYTKRMMLEYGIPNVRGGSYITMELTDRDTEYLLRELNGADDFCFQCGGDHFVKDCPSTTAGTHSVTESISVTDLKTEKPRRSPGKIEVTPRMCDKPRQSILQPVYDSLCVKSVSVMSREDIACIQILISLEYKEGIILVYHSTGSFGYINRYDTFVLITTKRLVKYENLRVTQSVLLKDITYFTHESNFIRWDNIVCFMTDRTQVKVGIYDAWSCEIFCSYLQSLIGIT